MEKQLKEKFDALDFVKNPDKSKFETCVGDDSDTWIGSKYLEHISGIKIGGFFNFDNMFYSEDRDYDKKFIGIDMSLIQEGFRCWDNHINMRAADDIHNPNSANINIFNKNNASNQKEYHKKFAGSTALQMFAYYDGMKPKTEEEALIWIAIDSGFKGHYNAKFKPVHNAYLEQLGLTWMIDILDKYTMKDMTAFINERGLNSKFKINSQGKLFNVGKWMNYNGKWKQGKSLDVDFIEKHLGFSMDLPKEEFELAIEMYRFSEELRNINYNDIDRSKVLSMAFTYTNKIEFTALEENIMKSGVDNSKEKVYS